VHPQQPGGLHPAVPGDDLVVIADQDRVGEAELLDTVRDLSDLLLGMAAGILAVGCRKPATGIGATAMVDMVCVLLFGDRPSVRRSIHLHHHRESFSVCKPPLATSPGAFLIWRASERRLRTLFGEQSRSSGIRRFSSGSLGNGLIALLCVLGSCGRHFSQWRSDKGGGRCPFGDVRVWSAVSERAISWRAKNMGNAHTAGTEVVGGG